ncbi:hypothetical protein WMY93_009920 [Mugilogobius chulae]|uniref:Ion transport domain-containing protein n=1 Tax=Mugilogobius chulae TaxID=88201 RepID=A0AAW0P987_9GOBI
MESQVGMRILVTLLLDTLPMLGNVLLLCFFVFFIFGIVGVQLWAGLLRNRCFLEDNLSFPLSLGLSNYYKTENDDENPFICSMPRDNGMRGCETVPRLFEEGGVQCNMDMYSYNSTDNTTCVNWNQYYTNCSAGPVNPFKDAINFDNICYAWIAIFQVITLEGWVDIMYFVMDAHSFYNFIYFILLIIIGSFFMINLCWSSSPSVLRNQATESQLMKEQRVRFMSNASTLASLSEPGSCYDELSSTWSTSSARAPGRSPTSVRPRPQPLGHRHGYHRLHPGSRKLPYCAKEAEAAAEAANETPGDSDSEGVYEFTQDIHHRDRRDSRQPRKKHQSLGKTAARVVRFWRLVCDTFRKIVDSKYFGRGIMIAIMINTLSMGIEYHEQILTQEDWNKVLYNGMASTTPVAALYFIALMTFGNYVLFNLLVAILVEGFQTEVPFLYRSASMHSSRPPSLLGLRPPEHRDCNGKGSPAVLGPTHVSVEENTTEDENAEEEVQMGRSARLFHYLEKKQPEWCKQRDTWSLYLFPPESRFRIGCNKIITHKMFDHVVLVIISSTASPLPWRARHRPGQCSKSHCSFTYERIFLTLSNYIFTSIFVAEMTVKIVALGWCFGDKAYLRSSWNILDGMLVMISVIDILVSLISNSGTKILGMLRVLRLLRTLRPLR